MIFFLLPVFAAIAAVIAVVCAVVVFAVAYVFIRRAPVEANRFGPPSSTRTVIGAVGRGVWRIFDFQGRANRTEFWAFAIAEVSVFLFFVLAIVAVAVANVAVDISTAIWVGLGLLLLAGVAGALCSLSLAVRRLHDVNRSGWWLLLLCAFGYFILLYWFLQPSVRSAEEDAQAFT